MTTLSLSVPDSLHRAIEELAAKNGYSMNQFLLSAAAEKLAALSTADYLKHRGGRADLDEVERILDLVPSVKPDPGDEIKLEGS